MDVALDLIRDRRRDHLGEQVLDALHDRITTGALARERVLPVAEPLQTLFPEHGLVRGRVVSCRGAAAMTIACSTMSAAMTAGAWTAVVDVPTFGPDAAAELGVPLERVVRIDTVDPATTPSDDRRLADWIDVMGAAIDGFDLVVAAVPQIRGEWRPAAVRKLAARIRQRGAVVLTIGDAGVLATDHVLDTTRTVWSGLGDGHGHLRCRSVEIEATGRRLPGPRRTTLEFADGGRGIVVRSNQPNEIADRHDGVDRRELDDPVGVDRHDVDDPVGVERSDIDDPQAEVLAEMRLADRAATSATDLAAG